MIGILIAALVIVGFVVGALVVPVSRLITAKAEEARGRTYRHVHRP